MGSKSELPVSIAKRLRVTDPERPAKSCWEWHGALSDGYGYVRHEGHWRRVHRVAYEAVNGTVADGLVLDHLCGNKACANPDHLEAVTQRTNLQRALMVTQCLRGHAYDEANTYVSPAGRRYCRACKRIRRSKAIDPTRPETP